LKRTLEDFKLFETGRGFEWSARTHDYPLDGVVGK